MARSTTVERKTKETEITLILNLDGTGKSDIKTGIGFLDHMLNGFAKHGFFDMKLEAVGDLFVDAHHTVEDVGIVLGQAIKNALGNKAGIKRYGSFILPMDEALVLCAIDLSGRPYYCSNCRFLQEKTGDFDTALVEEFFYALSYSAGMNLHFRMLSGTNAHHIIEAMFKAFSKALDEAVSKEERTKDVLSTKGSL